MCLVGIAPPFFSDTSLIFLILVNVYGFLVMLMTFIISNPAPAYDRKSKKGNYIRLGAVPDYVAVIFQCWRLKLMVLEVLLALYLSCRAFQLKGNWNVIFLKFQTTTRTILLSQLRRVLIDQIDSNSGVCPSFEKSSMETNSVTIVSGKLLNSNTRGRTVRRCLD